MPERISDLELNPLQKTLAAELIESDIRSEPVTDAEFPKVCVPTQRGVCCIIGSIRMNILMLDTRNVEQTKDVRMYT